MSEEIAETTNPVAPEVAPEVAETAETTNPVTEVANTAVSATSEPLSDSQQAAVDVAIAKQMQQQAEQVEKEKVQQQALALQTAKAAELKSAPVAAINEVSLGDDIKMRPLDKVPKLSNEETIRIAFAHLDDKGNPKFLQSSHFYCEKLESGTLAPENPKLLAALTKKLGAPKVRFGAIVVKYTTDPQGNIINTDTNLYAYIFGVDKFPEIKRISQSYPMAKHDLMITCKEETYQQVTMLPALECAFRTDPNVAAMVAVEAKELHETHLGSFMGWYRDDADIIETFQLGAAQAPAAQYDPFAPAQNAFAPASAQNAFSTAPPPATTVNAFAPASSDNPTTAFGDAVITQ